MRRAGLLQTALLTGLALLGIAAFWWLPSEPPTTERLVQSSSLTPAGRSTDRNPSENRAADKRRPIAPYIIADTASDSPGTNLETRVVTFTATVGGTPPLFLQWEVDRGTGFVPVSAAATNAGFKIPNAHLSDTGRYALFATNAAGSLRTTPVPLVIVEAED